jgi:hypothetical protein
MSKQSNENSQNRTSDGDTKHSSNSEGNSTTYINHGDSEKTDTSPGTSPRDQKD